MTRRRCSFCAASSVQARENDPVAAVMVPGKAYLLLCIRHRVLVWSSHEDRKRELQEAAVGAPPPGDEEARKELEEIEGWEEVPLDDPGLLAWTGVEEVMEG